MDTRGHGSGQPVLCRIALTRESGIDAAIPDEGFHVRHKSKITPGGGVADVARGLGPRCLVAGRPEELEARPSSAFCSYPDFRSRQIPQTDLIHPTGVAGRARDDARRPAAIRIREIVQAHDERRRVRRKRDPTHLADPLGVQEEDLTRPAIPVTDECTESRESNRKSKYS